MWSTEQGRRGDGGSCIFNIHLVGDACHGVAGVVACVVACVERDVDDVDILVAGLLINCVVDLDLVVRDVRVVGRRR